MFKMLLRVPLNLYKYKGSFRRLIAAISDLQMFKMGFQIFSLNEQLFLFMFFFFFNLTTSKTDKKLQKVIGSLYANVPPPINITMEASQH